MTTHFDRSKPYIFWALAWCLGFPLALTANEVDQFTQRDIYEATLPDSLARLNVLTNSLLDSAVATWNRRFASMNIPAPFLPPKTTYHYLALFIHNAIAREDRNTIPTEEENIPDQVDVFRALFKSGRGPLQTMLEDPIIQGEYLMHIVNDVYRDVYPQGYNTSWVIKVAGILTGTDKIDHFFDQGYEYWRLSNDGTDAARAIRYGVESEYGWFGWVASGVFSFGDLRANWNGYQFYLKLASYFRVNPNGIMVRTRPFNWQDWIDWQVDELLNPSAYTGSMYHSLRDWIARWEQDFHAGKTNYSYHRTWERLKAKGYFDHQKWQRSTEYLNNNIPHEFMDLFEAEPPHG